MKLPYFSTLLFLCAFFSFSALYAQHDFLAQGVIFEKGTSIRIALAQITNKRTKLAAGSNDLGLFQIRAVAGDTLLISKRSFSDQEIVVTGSGNVFIYLVRSQVVLQDVTIRGQTKKQELDDIKRAYQRKGSFYAGKPPILSYFFKPLTAIYELIGKTPGNARRFSRYYETEMEQMQIDGFFNKPLIMQSTSLSGKELEDFMLDYRPGYNITKTWNQYDAIKYIQSSAKKYRDTLGTSGKK